MLLYKNNDDNNWKMEIAINKYYKAANCVIMFN